MVTGSSESIVKHVIRFREILDVQDNIENIFVYGYCERREVLFFTKLGI